MVRAVAAYVAPSTAAVALRAGPLAFALTLGYFVSLASVIGFGRPEVAVVAPPVAVFVKVAFNVSIRILLLAAAVDAADFLVCVSRICIEAFTTRPVFAFPVEFQVCLMR